LFFVGVGGKVTVDSDDSDSDGEEDGYDSDVTKECQIDFTNITYSTPMRENGGELPMPSLVFSLSPFHLRRSSVPMQASSRTSGRRRWRRASL
jgi:hypothetical protein